MSETIHAVHQALTGPCGRGGPQGVPGLLASQMSSAIRRGYQRFTTGVNQAPTVQPRDLLCPSGRNTSALTRTRWNQHTNTTAQPIRAADCAYPAEL